MLTLTVAETVSNLGDFKGQYKLYSTIFVTFTDLIFTHLTS